MKTTSFEGKRHLKAALRRRQGFQAHAYSVATFTLPVLVFALVARGRSLSAEGGTPRGGGASALAHIRWPRGIKGKVSGDSCEPHPFPTWLRRTGEEHWLPVPVAGVVGSGRRGGRSGGVCTTLGNLVWGKERIVPKILSCCAVSFIHFIHSCWICVLSTATCSAVF